jgi:hypothetical protein
LEITGNALTSQMENHTFHFSFELNVDYDNEILYIINGGGGPILPGGISCAGKGCSVCEILRDNWNRPIGCNCKPGEQDDPQTARCDHTVTEGGSGGASWATFFLAAILAWFNF